MAQSVFHRDGPSRLEDLFYRERVLQDAEKAKRALELRGVTPQQHDPEAIRRRAVEAAGPGASNEEVVQAYALEVIKLRPALYKHLYG